MTATVREELQDEFLSTLRKGQGIALDALKTLVETIQFVTPPMPEVKVPLAHRLPKAHQVVAGSNDFAEQLLANQRRFADDVIDVTAPLMPNYVGKPAVTKPAATKPAATKPVVTKPAVAEPTVTKAVAKPAVAEPAVTKAAVAKPAVTKPAVTKPAVTKPAVTKPAVTKPATKPAVTKPAVTKSAAG